MTIPIFTPLSNMHDVILRDGAGDGLTAAIKTSLGVQLPSRHEAALRESNGVQVFGGYFTLFGIGSNVPIDIRLWNEKSYWKFAWGNRCDNYLCFAETAWGDQYAYNIEELKGGSERVFLLDCLSMDVSSIAQSFNEFLECELFRVASGPYDVLIKEARELFGNLPAGEHLIYNLSPLLGGVDDTSNIGKMPARSAMICNGDVAIQLDEGPADRMPSGVEAYDDGGRMRLKLLW